MKNKLLKLLTLLFILFPIKTAFAVNAPMVEEPTWQYSYKYMPLKSITNTAFDKIPDCSYNSNYKCLPVLKGKDVCTKSNDHSGCMRLRKKAGNYYLPIREVYGTYSGGTIKYLTYCLHVGKDVGQKYYMKRYTGFNKLPDLNYKKPGEDGYNINQSVLKNIVASGYQPGEKDIDKIVSGSSGDAITGVANPSLVCTDETSCKKYLVTQILIWEVTSGARKDYNAAPSGYPKNSPYNLIIKGSILESTYKDILKKAKDLAEDVDIPNSNGQTYTLKWSDSQSKYVSDKINIGEFNVTTKSTNTLSISSKTKKNNITISSTTPITSEVKIEANYKKGTTVANSTDFQWFEFIKTNDGKKISDADRKKYQNVLMGDYSILKNMSFNVKTESGEFKISKIDSETGEILNGAAFDLYKCNDNYTSCDIKVTTIDMTSNAQTVSVKIDKSGKYKFVETKVPYGYQNMGEFFVDFNINSSGKAEVSSINSNTNVNIQILNGVLVKNSIVVKNTAKNFKISKIDGNTNAAVSGATFQILDSNNNPVKFESLNGKYKYSTSGTITDLVDSSGEYIISLLPQGTYTILETAVPFPYSLSGSLEERKTYIKIDSNSNLWVRDDNGNEYISPNATVTIKNFKTLTEIIKTGEKGAALKGVVFELYDSSKRNQIKLVQSSESVYDYSSDQSISPIQMITNDIGKITINYLPPGKYWVKETITVGGHVIDKDVEWTELEVIVNRASAPRVTKTIRNAKSTFNFYKIDEDGNYLSAGKFKLQVYNNKTKKFEDASLIYNEDDNTYIVDKTGKSDVIVFTPVNGIVTFVDVEAKSRYRVVEIEAPEGFILPKVSETEAEIIVNENGYALGDSVIINKKITTGEGAQAKAEFIVSVSTGQNRINYILIISALLIITIGLFILNRKMRKK